MEIKDIIAHDRSDIVQDVYFGITVMFVVLSIVQVVGLMGVYAFKCTIPSQETAHYVMAALGFISGIMINVLLFIRRLIWWNHAISRKKLDTVLLGFNFLYVAGVIASAIVFTIQILGIPEMILSFLLQAERLFLIYDIWKDPESFINNVVKRVTFTIRLKARNDYPTNMEKLSHQKKPFV